AVGGGPGGRRVWSHQTRSRRIGALVRGCTALGSEAMTALTLNGVGHAFFGRTVLSRVSLSIRRGEVVALVGPSGCVRADLCSSRSVRKIIIGMIIGHAFNRPTQANLL